MNKKQKGFYLQVQNLKVTYKFGIKDWQMFFARPQARIIK